MYIRGLTKLKIGLNKPAIIRLLIRVGVAVLFSFYLVGLMTLWKWKDAGSTYLQEVATYSLIFYFPVTVYQWLHKIIDKTWVCVLITICLILGFVYLFTETTNLIIGFIAIAVMLLDVLSCFTKETLNPKTKFTALDIISLIQQGRVSDSDVVLYAALLKPLEVVNSDPEKARAEAYSQLLEYRRTH